MAKFNVELVTPEELVFSADAEMVVVPGIEGDLGVLEGHSPMITTLRTGIIDIYETSASVISKRIFVTEGFAEITNARCTILARSSIDVTNNADEAARLLKTAEDALAA